MIAFVAWEAVIRCRTIRPIINQSKTLFILRGKFGCTGAAVDIAVEEFWPRVLCKFCNSLDVLLLDESLLCFWSNFGRLIPRGKFHYCVLHLRMMGKCWIISRGLLERQRLRYSFVTLSSLTHVSYSSACQLPQMAFQHLFICFLDLTGLAEIRPGK